MVILVDLDNVVADLTKKWVAAYNSKYNGRLKSEDITQWDSHIHATNCSSCEYYALIDESGFFADLEVLPNAIEITEQLQQLGHILYFVTATPLGNPTASYDKIMWVNKHFPHIGGHRVIQTHDKYMINGHLLFDDSPKNLADFHSIKVAMDYAYNKDAIVDYRVKNWKEFYEVVEKNLTNTKK